MARIVALGSSQISNQGFTFNLPAITSSLLSLTGAAHLKARLFNYLPLGLMLLLKQKLINKIILNKIKIIMIINKKPEEIFFGFNDK
jgi:hypothetical protein